MSAPDRDVQLRPPSSAAAAGNRLRALAACGLDRILRIESTLLRFRNPLFILFIAGTLAYGAGLAWYGLSHFDKFDIIFYNFDDAFYYFQIAWNLAQGNFSTFDGGITSTNGYHPLWMFLITPFYLIFDKDAALFGIKALELMLIAGAVVSISVAARFTRQPWFLLFATLPILYSYGDLHRGMEAAAALFMLGLFFLAICLHAGNAPRWRWLLAIVAFALPWARLEYVVISLTCTVALWVGGTAIRGAPAAASSSTPLRPSSIPIIGALAGLLVYFAYNQVIFGGIVPVSGATKAVVAQVHWAEGGGYEIARALRETLRLGVFDSGLPVAAEVCVYFLLVWWLVRRFGDREGRELLTFLVCMAGLAAFHVAQFIQIVMIQHPLHIPKWYHAPGYLMVASIVPVRCFVGMYIVRRFMMPRSARLAENLRMGILLAGAIVLFIKADFTGPFSHVSWTSNPSSASYRDFNALQEGTSWFRDMYGNTQIANRVLPKGSVIGSWDSGIFGYFSRFPVVNLDGLTNSYDYLRAIHSDKNLSWWPGNALDLSPTYRKIYRNLGITHLANLSFTPYDDARHVRSALHVEPASGGGFGSFLSTVEAPESLDAGAWFYEKMEPHFNVRAGDMGVVVDGRLAYAVARNCAPGEMLFWRWGESPRNSALRRLNKTVTGLCTDMVVLPHGAVSPMSVERGDDFVERTIRGRQPRIRSSFDVYVDTAERIIIYRKEGCVEEDVEMRFFLHVQPANPDLLTKYSGFDNFDFGFGQHGQRIEGSCVAIRRLPRYPVALIRTGQLKGADFHRVWEGSFDLRDSAESGKATP